MRTPNKKAILATCELYIKYRGRSHRRIEADMRALGYKSFTRRVLYDRRQNGQLQLGWIRRFNYIVKLQEIQRARMLSMPVPDCKNSTLPTIKDESKPYNPIRKTSPIGTPVPVTTKEVIQTAENNSVSSRESSSANEQVAALTSITTKNETLASAEFKAWLKKISPGMTWDWKYQQLIYDKLKEITEGTTKRLMLFLPPRHGKSELVTVRYPAWRLKQDPSLNIIIGSYNQRLANRFSRKVRVTWEDANQMQVEESGVQTEVTKVEPKNRSSVNKHSPSMTAKENATRDSALQSRDNPEFARSSRTRLNTVAEWETGAGGGVRAVGVGGGITGFGGKLVIIDDPIK